MNVQADLRSTNRPGSPGGAAAWLLYAAAALTLGFIWVPGFADVSYGHGEMLLLLNALFVTGVSAGVAILAFRGYMVRGPAGMLYAGCGLIAMSVSFLMAGLIIGSPQGPNVAITVHDLGVLCGSLFQLTAALAAGRPAGDRPNPSASKAVSAYIGMLASTGVIWMVSAYHLAPAFYVPGKGSTPVRQLVILISLALLTATATLLIRDSRRRSYPLLRYYGFGLVLMSLGLVDVFIAAPGSVLSWTGRIFQCGGQLYILAAFGSAIRNARRKGMDVQEIAAEFYLESEGHYRALVDALRAAVISIDPGERVVLWNPKAEALLGYNYAEAAGKPLTELVAADGSGRETLRDVLNRRPERYLDLTLRKKSGEEFPAEVLVLTGDGRWKPWTSLIIRDITVRKRAEEALQRYQLLSVHSRDIILHMRRDDGSILEANAAAVAAYGYSRDELLKLSIQELRAPDTRGLTAGQLAEADHKGILFETVHRRKDGSTFPVEVSSRGADINGMRTLISVVRDITARRSAERALRSSEEILRKTNEQLEELVRKRTAQMEGTVAALKNEVVVRRKIQTQLHQLSRVFMDAADPILIEDLSGTIVEMNREAETVYGWRRDELIGRPIRELLLPERYRLAEQLRERCRKGEEVRDWEGMRKSRSGRIIPSLLTAFPLMDESNKIAFVATISKDISARKEMEAQLKESQQRLQELSRKSLEALEADRRMVSRELHDSIGGSLAAIKFGLEDAAEPANPDPAFRVTSLRRIISDLADTIKETKRISVNLRPLTLDDLGLLPTIESYSRQFGQRYGNIRLVREIEVEEQEIPDEFKIVVYRVMQEALTNSAKHSGADTLHIRLRREAACVVFEVEDNGCGFSVNEVFGRNDCMSGYGLKSMQERTEICGGAFAVQSKPGQGACIRVALPLGGPSAVFMPPSR